jgi:two-component system, OmpR family, sensor histidine kinase KdpD
VLSKHKVEARLPPDLPQVPLDAALMQRVFMSLAGNVAKHTPSGTHLVITAREDGNQVEVSFEDNGPGLPKGREEEIFESFTRGGRQATRRGAGLGLAISRAIVAAHGGTIRAQTPESGKGARIVITLPLRR